MLYTPDATTQLDDLLGVSIADFDIPDWLYRLAVSRYEGLGAWLSEYWDESPQDGIIYPQGSLRLGTVVQPINNRDEYDVDLVCRRDIAKASTTQAALKADCGAGIAGYVRNDPDGSPSRTEGKRCWTLNYPGEPFHMDVLPAIPNTDSGGNAIWLTDRELRVWQSSNPIDYADWFHTRMRQDFLRERQVLAKRMAIDDVPSWQVKTALQRSVQALKRHRDMHFATSPKDKPASIIITTLAAHAYAGGGTLYEVLADVTTKMSSLVDVRNGVYWVPNPVQPDENFADRWREHALVRAGSSSGWSRCMPMSPATAPTWGPDWTVCSKRSQSPSVSAPLSVQASRSAPAHLAPVTPVSSGWPPVPACLVPLPPVRVGRCHSTRSTARSLSAVPNSLVRQAFALRARFPDAKTKLTPTRFTWTGPLQPNELSRVYTVRITLAQGRFPKVDVLDPALEGRSGESIPHLFGDGSLCLHLEDEWVPTMLMVDTTVPWTSEWLLNYEIWKATGVWYGGGEWPPPRQDPDQVLSTSALASTATAEI